MNSTHEARIAKHVAIIEKKMVPGWFEYSVPRVGRISVNCMTAEAAAHWGSNQCWVRIGESKGVADERRESCYAWDHELRGSAQAVAKQLCRFLKAPSKAVQAATEAIESRWFSANPGVASFGFDGLRCEEIAAMLDLDELSVFRAMDLLAERGLARNDGQLGWFRTTNELR